MIGDSSIHPDQVHFHNNRHLSVSQDLMAVLGHVRVLLDETLKLSTKYNMVRKLNSENSLHENPPVETRTQSNHLIV